VPQRVTAPARAPRRAASLWDHDPQRPGRAARGRCELSSGAPPGRREEAERQEMTRHGARRHGAAHGHLRPLRPRSAHPPRGSLPPAAARGSAVGGRMTGAERVRDGSCHFQRSRLIWMIGIILGMILLGVRAAGTGGRAGPGAPRVALR